MELPSGTIGDLWPDFKVPDPYPNLMDFYYGNSRKLIKEDKKEIKTMNYKVFQVIVFNQVTGELLLNKTLTAKTEREAELKALKQEDALTGIEENELNDVTIQVKAL